MAPSDPVYIFFVFPKINRKLPKISFPGARRNTADFS